MAISSPLDSTATGQADDVLYCANQHEPALFDGQGGRVPLSADDPDQQHLRDLWCEFYEDILAHNRDGSRPFPACGMDHGHHPGDCAHCSGTAPPADAPSTNPPEDDPSSDPVDPVEDCPYEDQLPIEPMIRIRATMFFDGTGNNRANVTAGSDANSSASYSAGYSNVALLEWAQIDKAEELVEHISIYVEGMGTTVGGSDDVKGNAMGSGDTSGIEVRVARGIDELVARIKSAADAGGQQIEYVHLDAFGFSRGAAAARHFVHQTMVNSATRIADRLTVDGYDPGELAVKFVGLYDTVASYGMNHNDDTAELGLRAISVAERVVQLAAAEEHRANFRLTNIASASNGTQIFLPGVHSDVGGGYAASEDEDGIQLFDIDTFGANNDAENAAITREMNWLADAGWYFASELSLNVWTNEVTGTRTGLPNTYSRIPLQMMAYYARQAGLPFTGAVESNNPIPGNLSAANAGIWAAVGAGQCGSPGAWFGKAADDDPDWHKSLRNSHLHFSSQYGYAASYGTMHPQFTPFSDPDPIRGRRQRRINAG